MSEHPTYIALVLAMLSMVILTATGFVAAPYRVVVLPKKYGISMQVALPMLVFIKDQVSNWQEYLACG